MFKKNQKDYSPGSSWIDNVNLDRIEKVIRYYLLLLQWLYSTGEYSRVKYVAKNIFQDTNFLKNHPEEKEAKTSISGVIQSITPPADDQNIFLKNQNFSNLRQKRIAMARRNFEIFYNSDEQCLKNAVHQTVKRSSQLLKGVFYASEYLNIKYNFLIDERNGNKKYPTAPEEEQPSKKEIRKQFFNLYTEVRLGSTQRRGDSSKTLRKILTNFGIKINPLHQSKVTPIQEIQNVLENDILIKKISQDVLREINDPSLPVSDLIRASKNIREIKSPHSLYTLERMHWGSKKEHLALSFTRYHTPTKTTTA